MGTVEIIIVFSALMALIALVTVGIDWIGKPLKDRRFIPRIYRFDDEKLPVDAYGHPTLPPAGPVSPTVQPPPIVVATLAGGPPAAAADALALAAGAPTQIPPPALVPAGGQPPAAPPVARSGPPSAFSDSLADPTDPVATASVAAEDAWLATGLVPSPASPTGRRPVRWQPGMALDATIDDKKPNLAAKAERFWMATSATIDVAQSHFGAPDIDRMSAGKAPRRRNPRTGRLESMQLNGLRQASQPDEVRMRWPEDSVDPWNTT